MCVWGGCFCSADRTKPSNVRIRTKASANKRNITKPMPQEEQVQDIEQREVKSIVYFGEILNLIFFFTH